MKTRNGFVSNSSSTSFLVSKERKEEALSLGLKLVPVKDIKKWKQQIYDMGIEFFIEDLAIDWRISELPDDAYITEPYDRDMASKEGIDFPVFEGDL